MQNLGGEQSVLWAIGKWRIQHKTKRNDADKQRMGWFSKNYVNRPISNSYWAKEYSCMVYAKMVALFQMIRRDETAKFKDLPGKSRQRRIVSHAHCLTICEKTRSHHETQPRIRGKRDVKLPW